MRKVASVQNGHPDIRRVILYACPEGIYVFPCSSEEDGSAIGDEWYASLDAALAACEREYGITSAHWQDIPDPLPHCQHDWIAPVRIRGRAEGAPQWGVLERLGLDGVWREIRKGEDGIWREEPAPSSLAG